VRADGDGTVKRTPLAPGKGLKRGRRTLAPGRPMKRATPQRRRSQRTFREVILRRDPICRLCGKAPSTDPHHILARGKGGSDDPENGAGLCRPCHDWITHTAEGIREGRARGLLRGIKDGAREAPDPTLSGT